MSQPNFLRNEFQDFYEILGLTLKATPEEIKESYMNRIKLVHPDKLIDASPEERQTAQLASQRLNEAKEILLDPEKREQYDFLYRQRLAEAASIASKKGFRGGRYNDYINQSEEINRYREEAASRPSYARPIIFVLILLMGGLSILWRMVRPEEITDKPREVLRFAASSPQGEFSVKHPILGLSLLGKWVVVLQRPPGPNAYISSLQFYDLSAIDLSAKAAPAFSITVNDTITALCALENTLFYGTSSGDLFSVTGNWAEKQSKPPRLIGNYDRRILGIEAKPEGDLLAIASLDKTIKIIDLNTGMMRRTLAASVYAVTDFGFDYSPGLKEFIIAYANDTMVMTWVWNTGIAPKSVLRSRRKMTRVALHRDWLAALGDDRIIRLYHLPSNTQRATMPETADLTTLCFSSDGTYLAAGGRDGILRIMNGLTAKKLETLGAHESGILGCRFTSDSRQLITYGNDNTIKLWDVIRYTE